MKQLALFVTSLFLMSSSLAATIYTWVDEDGVAHYSHQMPKGVDAKLISSEEIEPGKIGTKSPIKRVETKTPEDDLAKSAKLIKEKDTAQAKSICDSAKHSLDLLNSYNRLSRKDEKTGEQVTMTEEEKIAARAENEKRIKLFCQ
ncbi:DUF4124 domain-containing protein [Shewanella aestuarii]|uniref:DUF4124 domain-containing protein n=1 Tax=Shewanella aestuarii TaxID=1028752 RepID=A0A6G9QN52_9GAMM|nr:DUF4124 domain-containing protein [Shewanella aestuarii]QIR15513.1 DUF4124 domain-containing protein [Shewanella aestuarii]